MELPVPNQRQIATFQELYERRFGVRLSDREALEKGMSVLAIVKYKRDNAVFSLRQEEQRREFPQADAEPGGAT